MATETAPLFERTTAHLAMQRDLEQAAHALGLGLTPQVVFLADQLVARGVKPSIASMLAVAVEGPDARD